MPASIPLPANPEDALHNGAEFFRVGAYPAAITSVIHCLTLDPDNTRAMYYLGLSAFRVGRYDVAVQIYNALHRKNDAEAHLARTLLNRSFRLLDGDPVRDVFMFSEHDEEMISGWGEPEVLEPALFARLTWGQNGPFCDFDDIYLDLSIILGPEGRFLCTVPREQAFIKPDNSLPYVPFLCCSSKLFDRQAAKQLFFQRALLQMQDSMALGNPPQICRTSFPPDHEKILRDRAYPGCEYWLQYQQLSLFKITRDDMPHAFPDNIGKTRKQ